MIITPNIRFGQILNKFQNAELLSRKIVKIMINVQLIILEIYQSINIKNDYISKLESF